MGVLDHFSMAGGTQAKKNVGRLCVNKSISTLLRARPTEPTPSVFYFPSASLLWPGDRSTPLAGLSSLACSPEGPAQAPTTLAGLGLSLAFMQEHRIQGKQHHSNAVPAGMLKYEYMLFSTRREHHNSNGLARKCCNTYLR